MIRIATYEDAVRVAEININGWRHAYRGIVSDDYLYKKLDIEKAIAGYKTKLGNGNNSELFVFCDEEIIKGFSVIFNCRDEDKKDAMELALLYVDPVFQRTGIGGKLIHHFELVSKEMKELVLWVLEKNMVGISFYKKMDLKLMEIVNI